jgi:hypothetical protein
VGVFNEEAMSSAERIRALLDRHEACSAFVDPPHAVGPLVAALRVAVERMEDMRGSGVKECGAKITRALAAIEKALRGEQ